MARECKAAIFGGKDWIVKLHLRMKEAREKKGLSQRDAAYKMGWLSGQHISNFERGLCKMSAESLARMCVKYGIDPEPVRQQLINEATEKINKSFKKGLKQ
jgi:transcriptional regulator with XRE-family HTH domain